MPTRASATAGAPALDVGDLATLARGCAVLGSGGGGDPRFAVAVADQALRTHGPVALVDAGQLPDDGIVMPCALVGSPTVAAEKLLNGGESRHLAAEVAALTGRRVVAVMPSQIGGANGVLALAWAAALGVPCLDADGIGRAYPTLPQCSMELAGVAPAPAVVCDERLDSVVVRAGDGATLERIVRSVVAAFGGAGVATSYLMDPPTAARAAVRGSVTRALRIGARLGDGEDPVAALSREHGAHELIRGRIVELEREPTTGFVRGSVVIEDDAHERLLRLELQNEYLVALEDGAVRAGVPDILVVLQPHSGEVVTAERLRRGQRVAVVALEGDQVWRTDAGLRVGGPAAFGYDAEPVPLAGSARG